MKTKLNTYYSYILNCHGVLNCILQNNPLEILSTNGDKAFKVTMGLPSVMSHIVW